MAGGAVKISIGGVAKVYCIHDREKRVVTTEAQVAELGLLLPVPVIFNPKIHKLQRCACCDNLFFDIGDEPRYCRPCQSSPMHQPGGPLAQPEGVIS